jgi:predicted MFS family arabinose efflux permease
VHGLRFLVSSPTVRAALLTDLAATVLSMPMSLFPLINAERFGNNPRTLGLFLTAIAVGGVVASAFSGTFTDLPRPGLVMLGASAAWGVALALFGLTPNPRIGLAFLALAGAADTVAVVSRSTIVQLHTPDALLGRVAAAEQIVRPGRTGSRQHARRPDCRGDLGNDSSRQRRPAVRCGGGADQHHHT